MDKKFYFLIVGILLVIILIVFFLLGGFDLIILRPVEGECNIIVENIGENKVEMVFFTNEVSGNDVQEYVDFFLASEPFVSNKDKFNFFYAGNTNCEVFEAKAIFCYSKELLRKSSIFIEV